MGVSRSGLRVDGDGAPITGDGLIETAEARQCDTEIEISVSEIRPCREHLLEVDQGGGVAIQLSQRNPEVVMSFDEIGIAVEGVMVARHRRRIIVGLAERYGEAAMEFGPIWAQRDRAAEAGDGFRAPVALEQEDTEVVLQV